MGFRSTFITEQTRLVIPQWFVNKWGQYVNIATSRFDYEPFAMLPISSKHEGKTYGIWGGLETDIQEMLKQDPEWKDNKERNIVLIYLHECGGITKVQVFADGIVYSEPVMYRRVEEVTHGDHCRDCSHIEENI